MGSRMLVSAAALCDEKGRVLVQRRPAGRPMAGFWEFPGGKVEPGETARTALARELAEELGIGVEPGDAEPLTFASEGSLVLLLFVVTRWSGTPSALDAEAVQWLLPAALRALAMPPADLPFIPVLQRWLTSRSSR